MFICAQTWYLEHRHASTSYCMLWGDIAYPCPRIRISEQRNHRIICNICIFAWYSMYKCKHKYSLILWISSDHKAHTKYSSTKIGMWLSILVFLKHFFVSVAISRQHINIVVKIIPSFIVKVQAWICIFLKAIEFFILDKPTSIVVPSITV